MQQVKKIGILATGKIAGLFGLLFGIVGALFVSIFSRFAPEEVLALYGLGAEMSWASTLYLPVMYGVLYFLIGMVGAVFYNLFAKWVGGISIELSKAK